MHRISDGHDLHSSGTVVSSPRISLDASRAALPRTGDIKRAFSRRGTHTRSKSTALVITESQKILSLMAGRVSCQIADCQIAAYDGAPPFTLDIGLYRAAFCAPNAPSRTSRGGLRAFLLGARVVRTPRCGS